jgi:hypothetical protein
MSFVSQECNGSGYSLLLYVEESFQRVTEEPLSTFQFLLFFRTMHSGF